MSYNAIKELRWYMELQVIEGMSSEEINHCFNTLKGEIDRLRQRVAELERAIRLELSDVILNDFGEMEPRLGWEGRLSRAANSKESKTSNPDNWLTCQGNEMPPELAPAQIVVANPRCENKFIGVAGKMNWYAGTKYRPALDADGNYMVSREGLEPETRYVATDESGVVCEYRCMPRILSSAWTSVTTRVKAPDTHKIPGDWRDSLASVWDGEG